MGSRHVLLLSAILFFAACDAAPTPADPQTDWRHVLVRKKTALAPNASPHEKQLYADMVGAFVARHPAHNRARDVYQRIQLDFASQLAAHGRYQDAIRFYRSVLTHDPANQEAVRGAESALQHLTISRPKLLALEKGMTQRQVANILGKPIPGWRVRNDRRDALIESWYYRTVDGAVAGVYFREGVLFAAEASSDARLAPLTRRAEPQTR